MVTPEDLIDKLSKADAPSRRLDSFIAKAVGWKRHRQEADDDTTGEVKKRVLWVVPSGDGYATVPQYTSDMQAAYELAHQIIPGHVAALVWEDGSYRAEIEGGPVCYAKTAAIALCMAIIATKQANRQ